jgi:hypothetical protein
MYQYLYLNGSGKDPVLTSERILAANGFDERDKEDVSNCKYSKLPSDKKRFLYKYRVLDACDAASMQKMRSLLVMEEVWFARASTFNDVLEMDFEIPVPGVSAYRKGARENASLLNQKKLSPAKRIIKKQSALRKAPEISQESNELIRRQIDSGLSFYCLSEDPRNELLWGLYADGSKGVCVQFDAKKDPFLLVAEKVIYQRERLKVEVFSDARDRPKPYLHKSKKWEYEKEWRIPLLEAHGVVRLASNSISRVILGARADAATKAAVMQMNHERKARGLMPFKIYRSIGGRLERGFRVEALAN